MQRRIPTLPAVLLAASALALGPDLLSLSKHEGHAHVRNGAEWVTFQLPGIPEAERQAFSTAVANHEWSTVPTIRKADVRNVVLFSDTKGGEIVFHADRPRVFYSALLTEHVYKERSLVS